MKRLPLVIVAGILVWSLFLAVGAFRLNGHWGRPAIVMGCGLTFIGFWAVMLVSRQRRLAREALEEEDLDPDLD